MEITLDKIVYEIEHIFKEGPYIKYIGNGLYKIEIDNTFIICGNPIVNKITEVYKEVR